MGHSYLSAVNLIGQKFSNCSNEQIKHYWFWWGIRWHATLCNVCSSKIIFKMVWGINSNRGRTQNISQSRSWFMGVSRFDMGAWDVVKPGRRYGVCLWAYSPLFALGMQSRSLLYRGCVGVDAIWNALRDARRKQTFGHHTLPGRSLSKGRPLREVF